MNDFATLLKNLLSIKNTIFMIDHETQCGDLTPEKIQAIQKISDACREANIEFSKSPMEKQ